jgi:hypothetical protein
MPAPAVVADMQAAVVVDTQPVAADTGNRRIGNQPAIWTKGGGANQLRRFCVCWFF